MVEKQCLGHLSRFLSCTYYVPDTALEMLRSKQIKPNPCTHSGKIGSSRYRLEMKIKQKMEEMNYQYWRLGNLDKWPGKASLMSNF